jgi:mannose-6-phosphate isomerase class I
MTNFADRLLADDAAAVDTVATGLLKPERHNLVERPWGGLKLREFKGLCALPEQYAVTGQGLGESFEVAAWDGDDEARRHPSTLCFDDGSRISLPRLLMRHGPRLLGSRFVSRYGAQFPLLPKILDVKELLSVQGHPPGHTEVYVIIDAEPGASLRLGFARDMNPRQLIETLEHGRDRQQWLVDNLAPHHEAAALQPLLAPWFADRDAGTGDLAAGRLDDLFAPALPRQPLHECLGALKVLYWSVLDALNEIPVTAGQVIVNATPARYLEPGAQPSAEVHALGNPQRREVLALEVRRPGPTFRAWDNVRFPLRALDVRAAVQALNLRATSVADFVTQPQPVPGREGVLVSVDSEYFRIEHLRPEPDCPVRVLADGPHSLHVLAGDVAVHTEEGRLLGLLRRGESAIVPMAVGRYSVSVAKAGPAQLAVEVLRVALPV